MCERRKYIGLYKNYKERRKRMSASEENKKMLKEFFIESLLNIFERNKDKYKDIYEFKKEIATLLDVTDRTVGNYFNKDNDIMPDAYKLNELSIEFNVTIDELLGNLRSNFDSEYRAKQYAENILTFFGSVTSHEIDDITGGIVFKTSNDVIANLMVVFQSLRLLNISDVQIYGILKESIEKYLADMFFYRGKFYTDNDVRKYYVDYSDEFKRSLTKEELEFDTSITGEERMKRSEIWNSMTKKEKRKFWNEFCVNL
jgi:transcriptional regulator with XRE-family HTH domain